MGDLPGGNSPGWDSPGENSPSTNKKISLFRLLLIRLSWYVRRSQCIMVVAFNTSAKAYNIGGQVVKRRKYSCSVYTQTFYSTYFIHDLCLLSRTQYQQVYIFNYLFFL